MESPEANAIKIHKPKLNIQIAHVCLTGESAVLSFAV